jgi:hypothetical protein
MRRYIIRLLNRALPGNADLQRDAHHYSDFPRATNNTCTVYRNYKMRTARFLHSR